MHSWGTRELVSKKTNKPYHVCAREEAAPPRSILRREQTNDYSLEEALGEIAA